MSKAQEQFDQMLKDSANYQQLEALAVQLFGRHRVQFDVETKVCDCCANGTMHCTKTITIKFK